MKPTEIFSFGLILADNMPDGKMNGALATAVDWRKRRREKEWDFMRVETTKAASLEKPFFENVIRKRTECSALRNIGQAAYASIKLFK